MVLHHDNVPIHTSTKIKEFLVSNEIKILKHPPYSPDLSPCDFWLFPLIKQRLRGSSYDTINDVIMDFYKEINKLTVTDFHKCFDTWIKRCKTVYENKGEYTGCIISFDKQDEKNFKGRI